MFTRGEWFSQNWQNVWPHPLWPRPNFLVPPPSLEWIFNPSLPQVQNRIFLTPLSEIFQHWTFHAYPSDICVHKDLRNSEIFWGSFGLEPHFLPGELFFRHPLRRKQTSFFGLSRKITSIPETFVNEWMTDGIDIKERWNKRLILCHLTNEFFSVLSIFSNEMDEKGTLHLSFKLWLIGVKL